MTNGMLHPNFKARQRIHKNRQYTENIDWTVKEVSDELREGLKLVTKYKQPLVSVLGGAQVPKDAEHYKNAYQTGYALGRAGYGVMTGGGIGIMEAANKGAKDAGGVSIGLKAELIKGEEVEDNVVTDEMSLHFIFVRRFLLAVQSQALIFFPGGYGTLSEFFEFLVLVKLEIGDQVPLIFVHRSYWQGLIDWMHDQPSHEGLLAIDAKDIPTLKFADTPEEIMKIVRNCC